MPGIEIGLRAGAGSVDALEDDKYAVVSVRLVAHRCSDPARNRAVTVRQILGEA
jgi:hypothetical protein